MKRLALTPAMEQALAAIRTADTPFRDYLTKAGRIFFIINAHTLKALERRGLIEVDHVIEHPQPWVIPSVYYRLTQKDEVA